MSSASELQNSLSHILPSTHPVPYKDVSRARLPAQLVTYDRNESGFSGNPEEDIQRNELGIARCSDVAMETRRRRRFLEKTSDVPATESSSWRSKVYQKENTNTSNSSSIQHKETPWISYRTKDTLSSIDNHTHESDSPVESRRRRSEDSSCGDLSERLARRRARRLEEKRGSLSNDGSLDSQCELNRQWSRDSSIKSVDSCEVADQDDRLSDRWSKRYDEPVSGSRKGSRNTCDSLVFPGSIDNYEDVKDKLHKPSQGSEHSNRKESAAATSQVVPRKWSSKDSNFYSADSTSSFKSYDDGSISTTTQPRHTSLGQEFVEREQTGYSGNRRGRSFQNWSEDSAFSEMKETAEDALNTNNNNDNSAMADLRGTPIGVSVKRGKDSSKSKAGEVGGSTLGTMGFWVAESSQSSSNIPEVISDVSEMEGSQLTSRQKEDVRLDASLSLSGRNGTLKATSREDGIAKNEDLSCWRASFDVSAQSNVTSQTGRHGAVENHPEDIASLNAVPETREAILTAQDHRDVDSSSTTSSQPRESNTHRKRRTRKDKSALRKSALNMADAPVEAEGSTQVQHDPGQSEDRPRRRQLTATRQKFMQNAVAATETSSTPGPKPKTEATDEVAPIKIARKSTDFNQLLQKFSGSESNSEKSDTEVGASIVSGIPKRRSLVRRQEAKEVITSSEESDSRRTPDRTQSLKLPSRREDIKTAGHSESNSSLRSALPEASAVVEKSPSFRSEFMTRKWAGRSTDASHNEKETSPLRTVEPSKVGAGHAESKADIGISAAVSGQHNRTSSSKSQSLPVESSDAQSHRQRLSVLGDKRKDSKNTSQSTTLVHTDATITKQDDAVPKTMVLVDTAKSHNSNLDLISKYNQPFASERLASRHVFHTASYDSKQEKQTAALHIAKDAHTPVTTTGKVAMDKAKNPNTVVDLVPRHKESVISDMSASSHVASQSSSESKHVIHSAEVSKQVGSSVTIAAKEPMDKVKNPNTDPDLVSRNTIISDKLASSHVASQSSSESKPGIRAVEVSKLVDASVTKAAKEPMDKVKNPNTDPDLVSRHTIISDKLASSHIASQSSSESKPGIRPAEVSKQVDASVTTAAKVAVDKVKNPNTDLDLVIKRTVISDKLASHVASQRDSDSKPGIRAAEVNLSKQVDASVTTAAKVAIDNTKNPKTDPDLVIKRAVISDKLASSHVASQRDSESKPGIRAAEVNVSKQVDASAKTAEKVLIDETKSPNTNTVLISKHGESAAIDMSAAQRVTSTNKPESKLEPPSAKESIIKKGDATSVTITAKAETEKAKNTPKNTNLVLISENNESVTGDISASGHVASASSSDSKPKTIVADVNVSKQAESSVTTTRHVSMDKPKSSNTNLDSIFKPCESSTSDMPASHDVASTRSSVRTHNLSPPRDVSVTPSTDTDTSQHREHPVAKPRGSLERESKPETRVINASSTYVQSADFTSISAVSSTLTTSVSSPGLQTSNASSEITSSSTTEVRRASSFKEAMVTRTESMEKRKGILKRNTSLNKQDTLEAAGSSSFPVIDPQLAKILMQRKQMVGDGYAIDEAEEKKDEVNELVRRPRPLSAAEEIEENLRYSLQKAAQRGVNADDDEGLKRVSVADRIYSMQSKIEEEKFAAFTPKSRSGLSTPRSRPRSGFMTPTNQKSFDETIHQQLSMSSSMTTVTSTVATVSTVSQTATKQEEEKQPDRISTAVSGPQLMEKLSELASATERYQEKRHRFQHRARNDWRYQTQPVTYEEIQAADSLESVSAFRALVRKQTSINAFEQINAETSRVTKQLLSQCGKTMEFPQHLTPPPRHARRGRMLRHRTLPVTADELNAVPENQMLVTDPDWLKLDQDGIYDSKADSGILSGSDAESLNHADSMRSLTQETDVSDPDPSRMSVTDKTSMFRVLEEKTKADKEKSASGAKRYINRKKRERSQTMPITEEEVKNASEMGSGGCDIVNSSKTTSVSQPEPEVVNRSRSSSITEDNDKVAEKDDDELTKLSLSEKVRLFSQPREPEKQPAKTEAPVVRRRNRKVASRFNTQPVTNEEVEKAAASTRISPLAMSLVKPPDTEILKGLPLKDQRELMAQHAEMFLSKTVFRSRSGSSASQSQASSRRASVNLEEEEAKKAEKEDWSEKGDKKGILKDKSASAKDLHDTKSILKTEPAKAKSESEVHSILKMEVKHILEPTPVASEPRGILKKTRSEDMSGVECGDDIKGILKHIDSEEEECQGKPRSRSNSQPLGILKSEGFSPINEHSAEIKSILKAPSQENVHDSQTIKSAMRRGSMESDISVTTATSALKSAMRTRNRNSLDADDVQTAGADAKIASQEGDYNSNNSQKHMGMSVHTSEVTVDHFSSVTHGKFTAAVSSTVIKSSSTVESRTSVSASTTVTAATTSVSNLRVPAGSKDRSGQSASDDGESSSGEILESTPRTSKLKRKSRFSDKTSKVERYKTQPPELPDSTSSASTPADTPGRRKYKYEGRHRTQPITPDEMREAEAATPVSDLTRTPGGSIADRLNQLKTSGEEEWRKRVGRKEDILATPEVIKLREKPGLADHRPTSIADRLNELETSMTTWKERVEESDAKQFTVAARLTQGSTDSPLVNKLKNLPRKDESGSRGNTPLSSPVTPTKEFIAKIPLPKDIVQDTSIVVEAAKTTASSDRNREEEDEKREPVTVEVPDMGEEVENFFAVKPIEEIKDTVNLEVDDFDNMFIEAEMILTNIHKVRPKRKIKSSSRNPLKTMSQKLEIRQEYTEVMYGTAEKELKRVKKEGLAKDAGFAQAALAGLASTENFKQVELRRTDSGSSVHGQAYDPFKEPMLLHVKGRRSVQIRLVEPHSRSINEGDCYVLVTSDKVIYWEGQFANVIEKAKANEVASYIQQKKDLGCKKAAEVQTVYPLKDHLGPGKQFWASLEGEKQLQGCGPDAEDELYESSIVKCNMVYRLEGNALLPYTEYWGATLKHEMLKKNEVIVFDFGTEFYVWQGKAVSMEQRRLGMKLSKQLYEKGYNYIESPLNPMSPLRSEDCGGLPLSSPTRPSWTIFGKVNQNMETILFREKFSDWPDSSRLIGCKGVAPSESLNKDLLELKPFDAKKMIQINTAPVSLKLEGANVGRGVKWSEDMQGFVKEQDIITLDVTVWHVLEYEHYKLPDLSHGQFHDGDTYVVRWQYMIANANMRSLKGSAARNSLTGRERCAYFFWQGNESTINEKGASALMTVELDEERGPQIRVLQGKEPPCFLNLFDGKMIVHIGKREDPSTNSQGSWRLYCLRGDYENEVYLLEIPVSIKHLRSRSSMVLLNVKTGIVYIWHGAKSPKHVRELCLKAVNKLKENTPLEVGLHEKATITVIEVEEGEEKQEIWSALDQQDRAVYNSLLRDPKPYSHTIRLFHMSSVSLVFEVQEQLNPARVPDLTTPFPFLQSDLYKATQPALFLVDNDYEVYLWQGWWPIGSEDTENVHTGSAITRFNLDRRLAMETTLHYCKEKNPRSPPTAYLVCAGVEPVNFTSLFPFWEEDSTVKDIAAEERKAPGYTEKVSEILHRLTQTRYTLTELQERPLPEGVDPLRLETYLQDAEFEEILDMNREEFYAQPNWKQIEMKKHVGLF